VTKIAEERIVFILKAPPTNSYQNMRRHVAEGSS
jgi:hypothetical protein